LFHYLSPKFLTHDQHVIKCRPSVCMSVTSICSLSFKARELKICMQIPQFNATKVTNQIFEILPGAEIRFFSRVQRVVHIWPLSYARRQASLPYPASRAKKTQGKTSKISFITFLPEIWGNYICICSIDPSNFTINMPIIYKTLFFENLKT